MRPDSADPHPSSDTDNINSIDIQVNMSEFTQGFIALMHKLCFSNVNNITCIETKVNSSKKNVTIEFRIKDSIVYTYTINVNKIWSCHLCQVFFYQSYFRYFISC